MTLAYHYVLPFDELSSASRDSGQIEKATAAVYCKHLLGRRGVIAISILVMCSTFISLNGNALTGPRAYFAMARDGLFPRALPGAREVPDPGQRDPCAGNLGDLADDLGHDPDPSPPALSGGGLLGPIATAWRGSM